MSLPLNPGMALVDPVQHVVAVDRRTEVMDDVEEFAENDESLLVEIVIEAFKRARSSSGQISSASSKIKPLKLLIRERRA